MEYTLAGLDLLLHRLGWSVQVPARRAAERDEAADRRLAAGDLAGGKKTAADLGAWLCFEDESGQGAEAAEGRTWGRRGQTPVVTVTGGSNKRVSLAALIAVKPGQPAPADLPHRTAPRRGDQRKGFTETDYARFLDAAHQQLGGPARADLGQPEHPRQRGDGASLIAARRVADGLPAPAVRARAQPGGDVVVSVRAA